MKGDAAAAAAAVAEAAAGRGHRIHYARQIIGPAAPVACVIFDSPARTL